ncbi:MAG: hypothetical protein EXQ93_02905 [Alphaproteobacteria bacterium]|nr:hypothetical protein [Alphaproteobacteria bacterium]
MTVARRAPPVQGPIVLLPPPRHLLAKTFGVSLGLFAVDAVGLQLWEFVLGAWARNTAVGTSLGVMLGIAAASGAAILFLEFIGSQREMRKLREVDSLSREAA